MIEQLLEELDCLNNLWCKVTADDSIKTEVKSRIRDVGKVLGGMKNCLDAAR